MAHWAKVHDLAIVEGDQYLEQEVWVAAGSPLVEMHVTDWAKAQREDPTLSINAGLAEGTEADKCEDAFGRACPQQRRWTDLMELAAFFYSSWGLVPILDAQRQNWRSPALHGPQGTLCCHPEWVPVRCRSSRMWLYPVLAVGMFSGGHEWLTRYRNSWSPAHVACSMRESCLQVPLHPFFPLLQWLSYM